MAEVLATFGVDRATLTHLKQTHAMCVAGKGHQTGVVTVSTSTFGDMLAAIETLTAHVERYAEAAFNEGWRDREARPGEIINSRGEMRGAWIESNARDSILEGREPDHG